MPGVASCNASSIARGPVARARRAAGDTSVGGRLHSACIVELFRDVTDVNAQDRDGLTPLMLAAGQGHNSAVQSLLRHGKP